MPGGNTHRRTIAHDRVDAGPLDQADAAVAGDPQRQPRDVLPGVKLGVGQVGKAAGEERAPAALDGLGLVEQGDREAVLEEQRMVRPVLLERRLETRRVAARQQEHAAGLVVALDRVLLELGAEQAVILQPEPPEGARHRPRIAVHALGVRETRRVVDGPLVAPRRAVPDPARLDQGHAREVARQAARELQARDPSSDDRYVGIQIPVQRGKGGPRDVEPEGKPVLFGHRGHRPRGLLPAWTAKSHRTRHLLRPRVGVSIAPGIAGASGNSASR